MGRLGTILAWLLLSAALALPAHAQGTRLRSLELSPPQAGVNDNVKGTVTLSGPAPAGGAYVQLTATDTIWVPGTVVVPEGMTSAVFVVSVNPRASNGNAVVVGAWQGQQVSSNTLLCLADPKVAQRQAEQAAEAAQAAQAAASSDAYWDPYGWGYGYYGHPYPTPYIRPNTYTPVAPGPAIGSFSGMGGVPAGPHIDMGGNVPRVRVR